MGPLSPETIAGIESMGRYAQELNESSKESGTFQYDRTLPLGLIRLVDVQAGVSADPLICSLSVSQVDGSGEPFEAVSYVWGDQAQPHKITCNWRVPFTDDEGLLLGYLADVLGNFGITKNLYELLLRLRKPDFPRRLWIDQICINQNNLEEKGTQIRIMSEIYSAATNVLIWLGEEDSETETAFGMMGLMEMIGGMKNQEVGDMLHHVMNMDVSSIEINDEYGTAFLASRDAIMKYAQPRYVGFDIDPDHPERKHIILTGIRSLRYLLLERSWFRRSWTFQESIMASNAILYCGSYSRNWDDLYAACQCLLSRHVFIGHETHRDQMALMVQSVVQNGILRHKWAKLLLIQNEKYKDTPQWREAMDWAKAPNNLSLSLAERRLKSMLPLLRPTTCLDPRDKVLALLGTAHDDQKNIIFPAYTSPVANLYVAVVKYWLESEDSPDLSFLSHVQVSSSEHGLPSWAPDWSCSTVAALIMDLTSFQAAKDTKASVKLDEVNLFAPLVKSPRIQIRGFHILTVDTVESTSKDTNQHVAMISPFSNPYTTTSLSYTEAYRVLMSPKQVEDFQPPKRAPNSLSYWNHRRWMSTSQSNENLTQQSEKDTEALRKEFKVFSEAPQMFQEARLNTQAPRAGRAFFVSSTGFMGLVPKDTMAGDAIYIFLGAKVPFVVRKQNDDTFKLIGECYALGLMHGETIDGLSQDRLEDLTLI